MKKILWRRGQSAVEFSLLLPVFALLLFATIYVGMFVLDYVTLDNAAAQAARHAAMNSTEDYEITADDVTKIRATKLFLTWYKLEGECTKRRIIYNEDTPTLPEYVTVMIQATLNKTDTILGDILPNAYTVSKTVPVEQ